MIASIPSSRRGVRPGERPWPPHTRPRTLRGAVRAPHSAKRTSSSIHQDPMARTILAVPGPLLIRGLSATWYVPGARTRGYRRVAAFRGNSLPPSALVRSVCVTLTS